MAACRLLTELLLKLDTLLEVIEGDLHAHKGLVLLHNIALGHRESGGGD